MARERVHGRRHAARRCLAIALERVRTVHEIVRGCWLHEHGLLLAQQVDATQPGGPRRLAILLLARTHERAPAEKVVHAREFVECLGGAERLGRVGERFARILRRGAGARPGKGSRCFV